MRFNHFVRSKVITPTTRTGTSLILATIWKAVWTAGTNVKQVGGVWVVGMITKPKNVDVPVQTLIGSNIGIIGGRRSSHRSSRRRSSRRVKNK
jgi:hypothetical protein